MSFAKQMEAVLFDCDGMIYRGTACAIARDADSVIAQQAARIVELERRAKLVKPEGAPEVFDEMRARVTPTPAAPDRCIHGRGTCVPCAFFDGRPIEDWGIQSC